VNETTNTTNAPDQAGRQTDDHAFSRAQAAIVIARMDGMLDDLSVLAAHALAAGEGVFTCDCIADAALGDGPGTPHQRRARASEEGAEALDGLTPFSSTSDACAAFAVALFGSEIARPFDSFRDAGDALGTEAHTAFRIARAYLSNQTHQDSGGRYLLLAAALVVHRDTQKRAQVTRIAATTE